MIDEENISLMMGKNCHVVIYPINKNKELNIKNFGTFKTINKNERLGRNPKNKKIYKIAARKSLSFIISKKFNDEINKF